MAELLAKDLFSNFYWEKVGPMNINWTCHQEGHGVETHPADIVFKYKDAYTDSHVYVHFDLKSYAKKTITRASVQKAMESLSMQVSCAEGSSDWQEYYLDPDESPTISGCLFIYNHDGNYDSDFSLLLNRLDTGKLVHPHDTILYTFGPEEIFWINNVGCEIRMMRGSIGPDSLPGASECSFFYPQLTRKMIQAPDSNVAATIESLASDFLILRHLRRSSHATRPSFVVFYRGEGRSVEEFIFLLQYLRIYQVTSTADDIQIVGIGCDASAAVQLEKAKRNLSRTLGGDEHVDGLAGGLGKVRYRSCQQVRPTFSAVEIGMRE